MTTKQRAVAALIVLPLAGMLIGAMLWAAGTSLMAYAKSEHNHMDPAELRADCDKCSETLGEIASKAKEEHPHGGELRGECDDCGKAIKGFVMSTFNEIVAQTNQQRAGPPKPLKKPAKKPQETK